MKGALSSKRAFNLDTYVASGTRTLEELSKGDLSTHYIKPFKGSSPRSNVRVELEGPLKGGLSTQKALQGFVSSGSNGRV